VIYDIHLDLLLRGWRPSGRPLLSLAQYRDAVAIGPRMNARAETRRPLKAGAEVVRSPLASPRPVHGAPDFSRTIHRPALGTKRVTPFLRDSLRPIKRPSTLFNAEQHPLPLHAPRAPAHGRAHAPAERVGKTF